MGGIISSPIVESPANSAWEVLDMHASQSSDSFFIQTTSGQETTIPEL